MLSFEKWKLMNESLGGAFTLGVKSPDTIGVVGSNTEEIIENEPLSFERELEEAKKCLKKKMDGDVPNPEDGGNVPPPPPKKPEDDDAEAEADADEKGDHSEPDGDEDADGKEPQDSGDDGDGDDDADDKVDEKPTLFQKKKQKKGMKKEDVDRWNSLQSQLMRGLPGQKYWDGLSEDAVYPPADPNTGLGDMQPETPTNPQPGEVGYAPDSRVATGFGEDD